MPCQAPEHPADAIVGLESKYTVGARRLAVFAGTNWSFDKSSAHLKEFCGLKISDNTIRDLCQRESSKMEDWQNNDTIAHLPFVESDGEIEFQTDGTCVNTLEGWKEYRIAMFLRRMLGPDATPQEWDTRHLPRPHIAVAIAMIAEKNEFRKHWGYWLNRLNITDTAMVSVLADGAQWIWDSSSLEFSGKAKENLDIYHALEYLAAKGEALYGKGTPESATWFETMKWDLLEYGVKPVLDRVRLMASVEQLDKNRELLRVLANYLEYHKGRMNYRERLSEGRSIGSGQIEGACKNLIGARLKQTGARWDMKRVNRMGVLCAVLYGEQWNDYWKTAV
jgi:hypothetical protein